MPAELIGQAITVEFNGKSVLCDVDISVPSGQFSGVIGASGAGKTTLLRVLAGLQRPSSGEVGYAGGARPRPGGIALLAQHPRQVANPRWTLRQIIAEPAAIAEQPLDDAAIGDLLDRVGLDESLLGRYPAQVSDGQLQRACLGRILLQRPDFLLCDEPIAMLDPISARAVIATLAALVDDGIGVLLVSHHLPLIHNRCASIVDLGAKAPSGCS